MQSPPAVNFPQQILNGLQQMSQPHVSSRRDPSLPPPAITHTPRHRQIETPSYAGSTDHGTVDSSPSKGRSRVPISARTSGPVTEYATPATLSPLHLPIPKPQPQPIEVDEFRSPDVSEGEEAEGTADDAEGEDDEDVYTPGGNGRGSGVVLDSGRPEKPSVRIVTVGAIRSSVRSASAKIGESHSFPFLFEIQLMIVST
jgi:hypothetical protein